MVGGQPSGGSMRYPCSSSSVTSFRACQDGEASWQPPSLLWSGSSGMALPRQCQWCMTCGVPWHSAHQLGVGCPSKGKGFPQEDPVAPHIRLGGKFLWRQERGRLKPGEGCAGSPLLSKGKTEDSDCPLPPLSSLGCEHPPVPSFCPNSHCRPAQDRERILGDAGLTVPEATVGAGMGQWE